MKEFKGSTNWRCGNDDIGTSGLSTRSYEFISAGRGYFNDDTNRGFGIAGFMCKEDKNLIIAAPDLLEALQSLLVAVENIGGEHVTGLDILEAQTALAYAAIDKALGE